MSAMMNSAGYGVVANSAFVPYRVVTWYGIIFVTTISLCSASRAFVDRNSCLDAFVGHKYNTSTYPYGLCERYPSSTLMA
jgi:hypothetical protein